MQLIAQNPENFSPDHSVKGVEQVGAMMINHKTGAILGMIEGRDFKLEQMNHATQAYRQPGSTMKVLAAYLPALEAGIIQPGSVIDDVPIIFAGLAKEIPYTSKLEQQIQWIDDCSLRVKSFLQHSCCSLVC